MADAVTLPRPAALLALAVCALLVLTPVYYWVFSEFPSNSDASNTFLAAGEMASGNWRLKGWWWASDPLWTSDLAFEAGLIALLGHQPLVMALTAAFDWAGVVVLSAIATGAGASRARLAWLPVAVILALPILRNNSPMNLIALASMHMGTMLYVLAMFLLVPAASRAGGVAALIALDVATAAAVAGDPLALVVGVGAIAAVMSIAAAKQRDRRGFLVVVNVVGAALLGKAAMAWNQAGGGLHLTSTPLTFVALEDLPRNIYLTIKSFLRLTGSDFFGKDLGEAILYLIRLPFLLAMAWALYVAARRFVAYVRAPAGAPRPDLLDQLLLAAAVINIVSGVASSMLVNIDAARYFIPPVIVLAILAGRTVPPTRLAAAYGGLALGATVVMLGQGYAVARPVPKLLFPDKQALADLLVQHHLRDGYASYWSASIATVGSHGAARVRTLAVCTDRVGCGTAFGKAVPAYLLANQDWYAGFARRDRPFFVVVDKLDVPQGLPQAPVTAAFGTPTRRYDLPGYAIEVFDPVTSARASLPLKAPG